MSSDPPFIRPSRDAIDRIASAYVHERSSLTVDDARTLYLFGPGHGGGHLVRSSLEAALTDIRPRVERDANGLSSHRAASLYWLAAAGYLMVVDQLGKLLKGGFESVLNDFAGASESEAAALYSLRNAFLHNYGLVNEPPKDRSVQYRTSHRHVFSLDVRYDKLVDVGDRTDVLTKALSEIEHTTVDLWHLGNAVERLVANIQCRHLAGDDLRWRITDPLEFLDRCTFGQRSDG